MPDEVLIDGNFKHRSCEELIFPSGERIVISVPNGEDLTVARAVYALNQAANILLNMDFEEMKRMTDG